MCLQDAKGDQCDNCGQLLAAEELINPKCQLTGTTPVLRKTRHLYLDLPALTPELQAYITRSSHAGGWSSNCVQVTVAASSLQIEKAVITVDITVGKAHVIQQDAMI